MGVMLRVLNWNLMVHSHDTTLMLAGSTYCVIAALSMLGANMKNRVDTVHWLVTRQVSTEDDTYAGFNGRINKPADTCYSFWVGGALNVRPFEI
jgi:geranylgeranyl transferase type-1 subunit beta